MTVKEYLKTRDAYWEADAFEDEEEKQAELKNKVVAYNDDLVTKYPFLEARNVWDDKPPEDNLQTWLDDMPNGWRVRFGNAMCESIKEDLLDGGGEEALRDYRLVQVKEKFGRLRWYSNWTTDPLEDTISYYEDLSWHTCIRCGKRSKYYTTGWIAPYCEDCAKAIHERHLKTYPNTQFDSLFERINGVMI